METKVIAQSSAQAQKLLNDAKTRELNLKAKQAAKEDMKAKPTFDTSSNIVKSKPEEFDVVKNAKGVQQHNKPKPKAESKPKADKPITMASKLDEIITAGGEWKELVEKAVMWADKLGCRVKYNQGALKAHIKFRMVTQNKVDYLGNFQITENGIQKVTTKSKGKK